MRQMAGLPVRQMPGDYTMLSELMEATQPSTPVRMNQYTLDTPYGPVVVNQDFAFKLQQWLLSTELGGHKFAAIHPPAYNTKILDQRLIEMMRKAFE